MYKRNFLTRFEKYYQKNGLLKTILRSFEEPYRAIFKSQRLLLYAALNEVNDSVLTLPSNIIIDPQNTYNEIVKPNLQRIINFWDREMESDKVRERFEKGAILWIVKWDEDIAGFIWSIKSNLVSPWYLPLTPHDAYLFDAVTFEEYRGRDIYPLLVNYVLGKLKMEGMSRAVIEVHTWNTSSIRGLKKTYYRKFCEARKFHVFGRNITIWS